MYKLQYGECRKPKKALLFRCFVLSFFIILGSCKPEEPYVITCSNGPVKWEYPRFINLSLKNVGDPPSDPTNLRDLTLVIQTNADYEYYFKSGAPLPNIDFKRKTLLVVRTDEPINFQTQPENSSVMIDCDKKKIIWRMNAFSDPPNLDMYFSNIFVIVIPKIAENIDFYFETNILR